MQPIGPKDSKPGKPSPHEALRLLQEGNSRFHSGLARRPHADARRLHLAGSENQGDYAYATVLTCSDSRVPVELIFDAGVMDIFVIRVAGNVCGGNELGSIEFGLTRVATPLVVLLGHTQCGAVTAATHEAQGRGLELERNIRPLVDTIVPTVKSSMEKYPHAHADALIPFAIEENLWQGIEDLFSKSPTAREMTRRGEVNVVAAIYDVGTGKVDWLPEEKVIAILSRVEESEDEKEG